MAQLQQGFTTGGMGSDRHFAWQQSSGSNVRFGSKADIGAPPINVRFTPKSGHWLSVSGCPLVPITNIGNDFIGRIIASPSLQPWDREDAASGTVPSLEYRSLS